MVERNNCPCGSGESRARCCGRYLDGTDPPPTALACMRSRYTAYCEGADAYLRATWHQATCPPDFAVDPEIRWLGLRVRRVAAGGERDTGGIVEFTARWRKRGRGHRLHEVSRFVREADRWVYLGPSAPAPTPD